MKQENLIGPHDGDDPRLDGWPPEWLVARAVGACCAAAGLAIATLALAVWLLRLAVLAVLVLAEPLVSTVLVPAAFLGFVVTLIFGFVIGDPRFPRWGMLAMSVGSLLLYWAFIGLMSALAGGARGRR